MEDLKHFQEVLRQIVLKPLRGGSVREKGNSRLCLGSEASCVVLLNQVCVCSNGAEKEAFLLLCFYSFQSRQTLYRGRSSN